jgi:hypothetical protein
MRISHFLLALTFALTAVISAGAQSLEPPTRQELGFDARPTPAGDSSGRLAEAPAAARYRHSPRHSSPWNFGDIRMDADPTCFVLRTYRMTRVGGSSDVVQPGRTSICVSQERYSVRSAAADDTVSSR